MYVGGPDPQPVLAGYENKTLRIERGYSKKLARGASLPIQILWLKGRLDRFHELLGRGAGRRDIDREQRSRLCRTRISGNAMDGADRFPPGLSRMIGPLGRVTYFRCDRTRYDVCHHSVRVLVGRRSRVRWIVHLYQGYFTRWIARQRLLDNLPSR